jgi:hypothetical protein
MDVVERSNGESHFDEGTVPGSSVDVLAMPDHEFIVQGLAGYTDDDALQVRSAAANLLVTGAAQISDDVAGADRGATSVVALQILPGPARFAVLLASPGGLLLARFTYAPHFLVQEDLDPITAGVQVEDVEAVIPGATVIGRTYGAFAP